MNTPSRWEGGVINSVYNRTTLLVPWYGDSEPGVNL